MSLELHALILVPRTHTMSLGGDHSSIDAHIATLEEALDALKRERYSRDCSASGETDDGTRQNDEDKARALASENDLLLRVLRKVMLEKESPLITSHVLTKTTPRGEDDDDASFGSQSSNPSTSPSK